MGFFPQTERKKKIIIIIINNHNNEDQIIFTNNSNNNKNILKKISYNNINTQVKIKESKGSAKQFEIQDN